MPKKAKQKQSRATEGGSRSSASAAKRGSAVSAEEAAAYAAKFAAAVDFLPCAQDAASRAPGEDALSRDAPELLAILKQLQQRLGSLEPASRAAMERFSEEAVGLTAKEESSSADYLGMKVQLLLSYLIGLVYYLLLKSNGVPVREHPVVMRMLWIRTLLDKLRPVDQRLHYQMTKLLQFAAEGAKSGGAAPEDPHQLRPGQLVTSVADDGDEAEDDEAAAAEKAERRQNRTLRIPEAPEEDDGLYKPPKIAQVEYTGDHFTEKERAERDLERKKRRFEQSELVRSLREEFTDAPAEVHGSDQSSKALRAARKLAEIQDFEEENMTRMRVSKRQRKEEMELRNQKRMSTPGTMSLDDLANFGDLASSLEGTGGRMGAGRKGRKAGTALQEYRDAMDRVKTVKHAVRSTESGAMSDLLGGGGGRKKGQGKGASRGSKHRR